MGAAICRHFNASRIRFAGERHSDKGPRAGEETFIPCGSLLAVNDIERGVDSIFEICKNYGDHLYDKENTMRLSNNTLTVACMWNRRVIRKFLAANRLNNLTQYLEALHNRNMQATTDIRRFF